MSKVYEEKYYSVGLADNYRTKPLADQMGDHTSTMVTVDLDHSNKTAIVSTVMGNDLLSDYVDYNVFGLSPRVIKDKLIALINEENPIGTVLYQSDILYMVDELSMG
ncbi:MAG: hypothetical protein DRI46_09575 [Chloroflexi bacterium]|nr:MAG: hypothetical protein DRI46_09575 [Chloroflexota bacterium]